MLVLLQQFSFSVLCTSCASVSDIIQYSYSTVALFGDITQPKLGVQQKRYKIALSQRYPPANWEYTLCRWQDPGSAERLQALQSRVSAERGPERPLYTPGSLLLALVRIFAKHN